jgi:hypothetical protein
LPFALPSHGLVFGLVFQRKHELDRRPGPITEIMK